MLKWALLFLAMAIAAALAPMVGALDGPAQGAAKVLCFAALALFVVFVGLGVTAPRRMIR
jgi:uncharacterized membrane protein YtjA (UPF0391 family)